MDSAARRFACTLKFDPNPTSAYTFSGIDGRGFVSVTHLAYLIRLSNCLDIRASAL